MQTLCLLGFWDALTSSLMGLFPTVNKALKQTLPLASSVNSGLVLLTVVGQAAGEWPPTVGHLTDRWVKS